MARYEVWFFSNLPEYKPRGGIVAIEVAPPDHGAKDAEALAHKIRDAYAHEGLDVSYVVRPEGCY